MTKKIGYTNGVLFSKISFPEILVFLFLIFGLSFCGKEEGAVKARYESDVNAEMQLLFNRAESAYNQKKYDQGLASYQKYQALYPYNRLTDEAGYKVGKIYFIEEKWSDAAVSFKQLAQKTKNSAYRAKGFLLASYSLFKAGRYVETLDLLKNIKVSDLPTKLKVRHYSLIVEAVRKSGQERYNADYALLRLADVYQEAGDQELKELEGADLLSLAEVTQELDVWIVRPMKMDEIPSWFKTYPQGFSKPYVEYKWGKTYFEAGQTEKASKMLSRFIRAYPKHAYVPSAQKILRELNVSVPKTSMQTGDNIKLGVLLPLSGPSSEFGQATLRGIKCAVGLEGCANYVLSETGLNMSVQLLVRDSGNDPLTMQNIVSALASQGVSAIIGPMAYTLAEAAAKQAKELGVTLLPITQKADVMKLDDSIFQIGYPVDLQMKHLVTEARQKGLKTFGIFYPSNAYGKAMSESFAEEVKKQGGTVVAIAAYNSAATNMADEARKLKSGMKRFSYSDTGTGFDALFLPDSYAALGRIIPGLQVVTIRGIPLLGTNAWNDPRLKGELFVNYPGSFFVDLYDPQSKNAFNVRFVDDFTKAMGVGPSNLAALGFDSALLVAQAIKESGYTKTGKVKEALSSLAGFRGVTTLHSFQKLQNPVINSIILYPPSPQAEEGIDPNPPQ
ncbi:MAG: hypothetical protein A2048_06250 [Deltaproteobacteria bacterium GWA2_45_12]|nr:MAG: hypothetical protein A2048_06250 [Deltaproteobacteria bacterium GWA2_45_12]